MKIGLFPFHASTVRSFLYYYTVLREGRTHENPGTPSYRAP
jgi:hypothetical protein